MICENENSLIINENVLELLMIILGRPQASRLDHGRSLLNLILVPNKQIAGIFLIAC